MKKFLTLIIIIFNCLVLQAQWMQTSGPPKQNVRHLIVSGLYLIAVSDTGSVYRSSDSGLSWEQINNGLPTNMSTADLEINNNYLFAGTFGNSGIYRSSNNGYNWTLVNVNNNISDNITSLGVNETYLFAGTEGAGVFRSSDDGENWEQIINGLSNLYTWDFATDGSIIFVGTNYSGVFRSTDNGANWFSSGLSNLNIFKIGIHKSFQTSIFTSSVAPIDTIYKSTDYGSNWTPINIGVVSRVYDYLSIDDYLFISLSGGGVLLTTDAGGTWTSINNGLQNTDVRALAKNNNYLFAATYGSGVWRRLLSDITSIDTDNTVPIEYSLSQSYPNPFNPSTSINYQIPEMSFVTLKVYDVLGNEIKTLVNEEKSIGSYSVGVDALTLPSGVYFYRLQAGSFVETKKMVLMK